VSAARRKPLLFIFVVLLCLAGVAAYAWVHAHRGGAETGAAHDVDLPADTLFAAFHAADEARDIDAFERWALEIDRRRLLEALSPEEIEARLGKHHATRWVYLNQEAMKSRSVLTRWMLKKGDYWLYTTYKTNPYVEVAFCLAFDGEKLAWTSYQRHNYDRGKAVKHVKTYYAFAPASQPVNNANQGEGDP
jgi:hypothetical protein